MQPLSVIRQWQTKLLAAADEQGFREVLFAYRDQGHDPAELIAFDDYEMINWLMRKDAPFAYLTALDEMGLLTYDAWKVAACESAWRGRFEDLRTLHLLWPVFLADRTNLAELISFHRPQHVRQWIDLLADWALFQVDQCDVAGSAEFQLLVSVSHCFDLAAITRLVQLGMPASTKGSFPLRLAAWVSDDVDDTAYFICQGAHVADRGYQAIANALSQYAWSQVTYLLSIACLDEDLAVIKQVVARHIQPSGGCSWADLWERYEASRPKSSDSEPKPVGADGLTMVDESVWPELVLDLSTEVDVVADTTLAMPSAEDNALTRAILIQKLTQTLDAKSMFFSHALYDYAQLVDHLLRRKTRAIKIPVAITRFNCLDLDAFSPQQRRALFDEVLATIGLTDGVGALVLGEEGWDRLQAHIAEQCLPDLSSDSEDMVFDSPTGNPRLGGLLSKGVGGWVTRLIKQLR